MNLQKCICLEQTIFDSHKFSLTYLNLSSTALHGLATVSPSKATSQKTPPEKSSRHSVDIQDEIANKKVKFEFLTL